MSNLPDGHHAAADLAEQLDADYAEGWKPGTGDKLVGIVVDVSEREGNFGSYPIVTVRTAAGEELAVHAFHEVLANELARIAPKPGDEIGLKYLGKHPERGYHRYRVRRSGATAEVSWAKYAGDGDSTDDAAELAGVHEPLRTPDEQLEAEAAAVAVEQAEQEEVDADDIPF